MVRLFINPTLHLKNICHNQLIKSYSREKKNENPKFTHIQTVRRTNKFTKTEKD